MVENMEDLIRKIIRESCDYETSREIGLKEKLQDFGINSRNFIKIVVDLERRFNVKFDDDHLDFQQFQTIQSIINIIEEMMKKNPAVPKESEQ